MMTAQKKIANDTGMFPCRIVVICGATTVLFAKNPPGIVMPKEVNREPSGDTSADGSPSSYKEYLAEISIWKIRIPN